MHISDLISHGNSLLRYLHDHSSRQAMTLDVLPCRIDGGGKGHHVADAERTMLPPLCLCERNSNGKNYGGTTAKTMTLGGVLKQQVVEHSAVTLSATLCVQAPAYRTSPVPSEPFLFAVPTGVGKRLWQVLWQHTSLMTRELIRSDVSEFMEKHTVSS
ncbi:MAG: hypothetical protein ACLSFT_02045 [Ruminococcus callidus]